MIQTWYKIRVANYLAKAKKPSSRVEGDVLPSIMSRHHSCFVEPVKDIFNAVFATAKWPTRLG